MGIISAKQHRYCRGITRIHRLPSRPSHPYGRQPHSLIFMSTQYKASSRLPAKQLTNDHEPACMCHLYRLRINTHVLNQHHALSYRATWWQLGLSSKEDICVSLCQLLVSAGGAGPSQTPSIATTATSSPCGNKCAHRRRSIGDQREVQQGTVAQVTQGQHTGCIFPLQGKI